jgi:hypothetical protein
MTNIARNTVQLFPKNAISRFTVAYQAQKWEKVGSGRKSGKWIAGPKKFVLFLLFQHKIYSKKHYFYRDVHLPLNFTLLDYT